MNKERYFKDNESNIIITLSELKKEYKILKNNNETESQNFNNYLTNCMYYNNGTLTEITK